VTGIVAGLSLPMLFGAPDFLVIAIVTRAAFGISGQEQVSTMTQ
jgi:hypothetical protein